MLMKKRVVIAAVIDVPAECEFAARRTSHECMAMVMSTFLVPSPTVT